MLSIAILGEVGAFRDGVRLPLPAGKTSELLARLAVDPGVPVRVDTLVEDLWGKPVDRNTLQAKVSQLRRVLGDRSAVRGSADSYVLQVAPESVDAARATALARDSSASDDPAETVRHAEQGVALFRGPPLPGQGDWAAPYRTALDEVRWTLTEDLMAARVDLGGGADLVGDLERLVDEQPLRERLWASLMTALYRAGRQADALAAYTRVRTKLVEEMGVEPGPGLRALEAQVLAHGDALGSVVRRDATAAPGNLPRSSTRLVARDAELGRLTALLEGARLVTLVGPAGVGKTRLALEAAAIVAPTGGSWLVRLDAVDASADLVALVAGVLHVSLDAAAVGERLRGAPTLLVLDNCEHLADAAGRLAGSLIDAAPRLRVLATSQLSLGADEEEVVELAPLSPEGAVTLFRHHAERLRRRDAVEGAPGLVAEVCRSLDGLPLAIELAATRLRSLPLDEIARRLDDRFALLRDPARAPGRRHALEAALSWSYELLFPDDQRGLQAMACFPGGTTLDAVEAVLVALDVPRGAVMDTLGRLVERSLVVLDDTPEVPRYRLLDSVRTFARDRLVEAGDDQAALAAHARWYADRAAVCAAEIRGPDQARWIAFVRAERADVDAALAWSVGHDPRVGERIALGLAWAWAVLGDGSAGAARLRAAVGDGADPQDRFRASLVAAWLEASAGDLSLAHRDLEAAAVAGRDDPRSRADLAWHRAFVAIQEGRPADVREAADSSLAVYRELGLDWETGAALLVGAYGCLMSGDAATARAQAQEALVLVEGTGDGWGLVHAHGILGGVAEGEGRLDDAAEAYHGAASAAEAMGFAGQAALHRASWARTLVRREDPRAPEAVQRALAEATAVADGRLAGIMRIHAAQLARAAGADERARGLLRRNAEWYAASGGGDRALLTEVLLAALDDDAERLSALLHADLDPAVRQAALDALARVAAQAGDEATALTRRTEAGAIVVPAPEHVDRVDAREPVAPSSRATPPQSRRSVHHRLG